MFESILGNNLLKAYLEKAIREELLPQTLLFAGPEGVGKALFAKALAARLLGSARSADLHFLSPEGKTGLYAIDTLREMMEKERSAPFESSGKVFILAEVDRMQPASANALLKTLEEPRPDTTFILLTSQPQEILPTIRSRCTELHFQPLSEEGVSSLLQDRGYPIHWAKFAQGSMSRALEFAERPELEEQRKLLFRLLAETPSFPLLSQELARLEELAEEGKEEDPVRYQRRVEHLFHFVWMWHRDQHLRKAGGRAELLFFSDERGQEPLDWADLEQRMERAQLAFQRNMKLSHTFSEVFRTSRASF